MRQSMQATAYHRAVLTCLQLHYPDVWNWFTKDSGSPDVSDVARIELLKTAYRLDRETAATLYSLTDSVAAKMELMATITLYQAQHAQALNASLFSLPGEAHIVLHGPVQDILDTTELSALIAHELAHYELHVLGDGVYETVEQILTAMIIDQSAGAPHDRTLRSYRLYTELYCDRRAATVTGDMAACVGALVKMETGLRTISPEAYMQQAQEVLAAGPVESDGVTHPEMFIRARALELWSQCPEGIDEAVKVFVEGPLTLKHLDLLQQRELCELTADVIQTFLNPKWLRSDLMLDHARRFANNLPRPNCRSIDELSATISKCDAEIRSYFCYVLLDFVTYDSELEEGPLAAAFLLSEQLGLFAEFQQICYSELKLGKRALEKVARDATKILAAAEKEFTA